MALLARFIVLVPLVFSIVSAVLAALALFAGHEKGFMEDYDIARLNVSRIGYNLVDFGNDEENNQDTEEDEDDGGFFDDIVDGAEDAVDDLQDSVQDQLNELGNAAADELAEALGLNEWYSMHVMTVCQGLYKPESNNLNISHCNNTAPEDAFNIEEMLSEELELGPVDITLQDLNFPTEIQDQLDTINDALLALFVLYVLGIAFSGIGVFTAALAFFFPTKRTLVLVNVAVIGIAMLVLLVGSIVVTVAVTEGVDQINDIGEEVGVNIERGDNFLAITWAAAALTVVSFIVWCVQLCNVWREGKRIRAARRSKSSI